METLKRFNLEDRLVEFSAQVIDVVESIVPTRAGQHLAGQLVRSGTAPALNHAEAQSAESRNDFIHKMKIALKELRETRVCLRIISRKALASHPLCQATLREVDELIAIFSKSISTAQLNNQKAK
jgi:four helix bundle protein